MAGSFQAADWSVRDASRPVRVPTEPEEANALLGGLRNAEYNYHWVWAVYYAQHTRCRVINSKLLMAHNRFSIDTDTYTPKGNLTERDVLICVFPFLDTSSGRARLYKVVDNRIMYGRSEYYVAVVTNCVIDGVETWHLQTTSERVHPLTTFQTYIDYSRLEPDGLTRLGCMFDIMHMDKASRRNHPHHSTLVELLGRLYIPRLRPLLNATISAFNYASWNVHIGENLESIVCASISAEVDDRGERTGDGRWQWGTDQNLLAKLCRSNDAYVILVQNTFEESMREHLNILKGILAQHPGITPERVWSIVAEYATSNEKYQKMVEYHTPRVTKPQVQCVRCGISL